MDALSGRRSACRSPCSGVLPNVDRVSTAPEQGGNGLAPRSMVTVSRLLFLLVLFVAVVGSSYLLWGGSRSVQYVATRALPPYHQITEQDLRRAEVPRGRRADAAVTDIDALLGRYTLSAVAHDAPVLKDRVGPELPEGALEDLSVVGLSASHADALQGRLTAGDRVHLALASDGPSNPPTRIEDVLVIDVQRNPAAADSQGPYVVALAIDTAAEQRLLLTDKTEVTYVRSEPYAPS